MCQRRWGDEPAALILVPHRLDAVIALLFLDYIFPLCSQSAEHSALEACFGGAVVVNHQCSMLDSDVSDVEIVEDLFQDSTNEVVRDTARRVFGVCSVRVARNALLKLNAQRPVSRYPVELDQKLLVWPYSLCGCKHGRYSPG